MKFKLSTLVICLISGILLVGFFTSNACAATLFAADFEVDLSGWIGKYGGAHHGVILTDPLNAGNNVLGFTDWNWEGDIFTINTFSNPAGNYTLSFDYLGDPTQGGVPDDLGGYIGYSYGLPGIHIWLAGTSVGWGGPDLLPDTGNWEHLTINFTASGPFHLMLEDFKDSYGVRGDVYFDNIVLKDSSVIPEPSTLLLFGFSLLGAGLFKRKR